MSERIFHKPLRVTLALPPGRNDTPRKKFTRRFSVVVVVAMALLDNDDPVMVAMMANLVAIPIAIPTAPMVAVMIPVAGSNNNFAFLGLGGSGECESEAESDNSSERQDDCTHDVVSPGW